MKRKIAQRRPRTVEQLKLYIKQEWERIPPENLQKLVSSVPKRLLNVIKGKAMSQSGKNAPVPTSLQRVAAIKF